MDLIKAGEKRFLDLNEMEELRNNAYINSKVAKQRMKKWHDQLISNKEFQEGQKVLMYDTRLHIFPGKLKSRWIGPFVIHRVYSNGVVDLLNSNGKDSFRVNGYRLKPFMDRNRAKTEEKQSSAKFRSMKETSAKWAFCCQTIPQHCRSLCEGISQLRKWGLAHECHSAVQYTVTSISQLRNTLRSCCENGKLLRNWRFVAKLKLTLGLPLFVFFSEPRRQASGHPLRSSTSAKSSSPSNRKKGLRKEPLPDSAPEPSPSRPNPPPVKPAPPKPPARRYLTRSGGRPLQKKPRVESSNPSI
ncbi:hypothetical protein AAG906_031180 [Vitis piasezkii]